MNKLPINRIDCYWSCLSVLHGIVYTRMTWFWMIVTWTLWPGPVSGPPALSSSSLVAPVELSPPIARPRYGLERRRSLHTYSGSGRTLLWPLQTENSCIM